MADKLTLEIIAKRAFDDEQKVVFLLLVPERYLRCTDTVVKDIFHDIEERLLKEGVSKDLKVFKHQVLFHLQKVQ